MIEKIKTWVEKYDDISPWEVWENIKIKSSSFGSFQFWTALIFTLIFYLRFINCPMQRKTFLYYGDNISLWIPQLINSQFFNREFIFKGIDFFTHGGASEYFLRPNILTYNPIILLSSFILYAKNLYAVLRLYFVLFVVHSFLACLFTQKLCVRFLNFDKYLALFTAICFSFSLFFINNLGYAPFLFITCLMPVCMYLLLSCAEEFDLRNTLLATLTIITLYTSGYITLSIFVLGISLIFCLFNLYLHNKFKIGNILKILIPFLAASVVILPLYIAISNFHHITSSSGGINYRGATLIGTNPIIALRLLSNALFPGGGEQNSITLGLIPISILLLFIFSDTSNQHKMKNRDAKLAILGFVLFITVFFACLGAHSPLSYFMHIAPLIGKSHLYTRYLLPLSLLLYVTLAILLDFIIKQKEESILKKYLFLIVSLLFFLSGLSYVGLPIKGLASGNFFFELMLLISFISCLLLIKNYRTAVFISTLIVFSSSLTWFWELSLGSVSDKIGHNYKNEIIYEMMKSNYDNENKFINYLKNHSNREIVKIADITPRFYDNYMMKNMPWLLRGKVNISSYHGYDLHLARDVKYDQVAHVSVEDNNFIFIQNIEWLKKTGAEFVIFQSGSKKHNEELLGLIDHKTILELPHGTFVAKLKIRDPKNTVVNNGYIRVLSEDKKANIANFYTNNANYFSFEADSMTPLTAQYLFWPNKRMKPYINGKRYAFNRIDDLDVINIPAGKNKVEIIYENNALNIFLTLYFSFLAVFSFYTLQQIVLFGVRMKKRLMKK